jgi:hypothetical protein
LVVCALLLGMPAWAQDADADGVIDSRDNCLVIANPDQRDTNLDGFGNLCDPDFNQDGLITFFDTGTILGAWATTVPPTSADVDLDGDDIVGMPEIIVHLNYLGLPPGPSGLACAGTIPCEAPPLPVPVPGPGVLALLIGAALVLGAAWRPRRWLGVSLLVGIAGLVWGTPREAQAQVTIDLVWTATTGSGTTGGSTITAASGDQLTAQITLIKGANDVCCYAVSLQFDADLGDELDLVSATEFTPPALSSATPGAVEGTQESNGSQKGNVLTFEAFDLTNTNPPGPWLVGEVVFDVTANVVTDGADVTSGVFNAGIDAIGSRPTASPPGTFWEDTAGTAILGTLSVNTP